MTKFLLSLFRKPTFPVQPSQTSQNFKSCVLANRKPYSIIFRQVRYGVEVVTKTDILPTIEFTDTLVNGPFEFTQFDDLAHATGSIMQSVIEIGKSDMRICEDQCPRICVSCTKVAQGNNAVG